MTERVSPRNPDVSSSIDPAYIKAELLRVNPPENRVILAEAIDLAEKAHEGQWREQEGENVPFIVHPLRTAWALAHTGHVRWIYAKKLCFYISRIY